MGTKPKGAQSRPGDSESVRDRVEGLGPRAPLSRDGEEAEKQERRQVAVAGSARRRPVRLGGSCGSRRRGMDRGRGIRPAPRGSGPGRRVGGGRGGPRRGEFSEPRLSPTASPRPAWRKRGPRPEERDGCFRVPGPAGCPASVALTGGCCFAAVLSARVRKSSFYASVRTNTWREGSSNVVYPEPGFSL